MQSLHFYLAGKPRVVLARACDCTDALRAVVEGSRGQLQPLEELLSSEDKERIQSLASEKLGRFGELRNEAVWFRFCETNRLDADEFGNIVAKTVGVRLIDSLSIVEALEVARERYAIEILVLSEDLTCIPRIVTEWAKVHNVPSLHLSHGTALATPYTVHATLNAEKLAAYGQRNAEGYLDVGIPPDRISITGNPSWDIYAEMKREKSKLREDIWKKYDLIPNAPLLVFGTTWEAFLTACSDTGIYERSIHDFLQACKIISDHGHLVNIIVKDREHYEHHGGEHVAEIARTVGFLSDSYRYTLEDTTLLVLTADCLVSVDSNLSVEAMMCGTIAINLTYGLGLRLGPSFSEDSGILNTTPLELPSVLESILQDDRMKERLKKRMEEKSYHYNVGNVGGSTERVASLMTEMATLRNPLIAERDSLLQEKLRLKKENDSLVHDKLLLEKEFETVINSLSWRLTRPLRSRAMRTIRRLIKGRLFN